MKTQDNSNGAVVAATETLVSSTGTATATVVAQEVKVKKTPGPKRKIFTKVKSFVVVDGMVKPATKGKPNAKIVRQNRMVPYDFNAKTFVAMTEAEANEKFPIAEVAAKVAAEVITEVQAETQVEAQAQAQA